MRTKLREKVVAKIVPLVQILLAPVFERIVEMLIVFRLRKITQDTDGVFEIGKYCDLSKLPQQREMRSFIRFMVSKDEPKLNINVKDLASVIYIFARLPWLTDLDAKRYVPSVADIANHIAKELNELLSGPTIARGFISLYKAPSLCEITGAEREDVAAMLEDKKKTLQHYFLRYNDDCFSFTVVVYAEYQPVCEVRINPAKIGVGFFIVGFDYYNKLHDKWLTTASSYKSFYHEYERWDDGRGKGIWYR
ncbi:hypothetical protein ACN1T8_002347 [Vibrio cholerae]|uniref:hypothetical protein n=1 Tax=Vibrio cholerae TaxID=666 RepID=UPI001C92E266|nr:hypothetical protein [Vibrio cholerae]MBY4643449.1 hypothetical protein [Vibrio cholerae]MCR9658656.1 hypothetical protein [Vibrio cholerae]MCR9689336.1 hypothetical protein [Vibrio cholerae]MCR9738503.1 hypothetical protein [Vibrio cholerae]MCR9746668.1 hypothetical protein [Vibrio cholerae]